eukprot:1161301-Pelagomonas_calceolata.AAC.3
MVFWGIDKVGRPAAWQANVGGCTSRNIRAMTSMGSLLPRVALSGHSFISIFLPCALLLILGLGGVLRQDNAAYRIDADNVARY